jgi:hypothetical protein
MHQWSIHICTHDGGELGEWETIIRGIHGPEYLEGGVRKRHPRFLSPINQTMVSSLLQVLEEAF